MKALPFIPVVLSGLSLAVFGPAAGAQPTPKRGIVQAVRALQEGPHSRVLETVWARTNEFGEIWLSTNRVVELATGLHRWDPKLGRWELTSPGFRPTADGGFIADQTRHRLALAPDLATEGSVVLETPDGGSLRSTILGIALLDARAASGTNVLIGELRSCKGEQTGPGEVLYRDAFDGVRADVRYVVTRSAVHQEVLFRERFAPEEWGLPSASARLVVLTRFPTAPEPIRRTWEARPAAVGSDGEEQLALVDEQLEFGEMVLDRGTAFGCGGVPTREEVAVCKTWEKLEGTQFLVEVVEYSVLAPLIETLPEAPRASVGGVSRRKAYATAVAPAWALPAPRLAQAGPRAPASAQPPQFVPSNGPSLVALAAAPAAPGSAVAIPGVVLDYVLLQAATNLTIESGVTYLVADTVNLNGACFMGNSVIKYTNSANSRINLTAGSTLTCKTRMHEPVTLTALSDDTIGEILPWSNGNPTTNYFANIALYLPGTSTASFALSNFRIAYAQTALSYSQGTNHVLAHSQLNRCGTAVSVASGADVSLRNVLVWNGANGIGGASSTVRAQNVTFDALTWLNLTGPTVYLTNCLLVAVTNTNSYQGQFLGVAGSGAGVFQTVGAGAHYLAADCAYRNAGTTSIDSGLLGDLRQRTTAPPLVKTNLYLGGDQVLSPQAQRDGDAIDEGYHYDALDWVFHQVALTNATLTLQPGTVLGWHGDSGSYGLLVADGGSLTCVGTADSPISIVRYNAAQDVGNTTWSSSTVGAGVVTPWWSPTASPAARFRFTRWVLPSGGGYQFRAYQEAIPEVTFSDCDFHAGAVASVGPTLSAFNCLFENTIVSLDDAAADMSPTFRNNLFWHGLLDLMRAGGGTWTFTDNHFDRTTLSQSATLTHGYNAYETNYNRLTPTYTNDVLLASPLTFQTSTYGNYYQPTNSPLINAGSVTNAALRGLYHFSVRADQTKEGTTALDIGAHWVAASGGAAADADGDGAPDYLEDTDGDGVLDAGETDWNSASDVGLKVLITEPKPNANLP